MKNAFLWLILAAATFAPGCASQRKIQRALNELGATIATGRDSLFSVTVTETLNCDTIIPGDTVRLFSRPIFAPGRNWGTMNHIEHGATAIGVFDTLGMFVVLGVDTLGRVFADIKESPTTIRMSVRRTTTAATTPLKAAVALAGAVLPDDFKPPALGGTGGKGWKNWLGMAAAFGLFLLLAFWRRKQDKPKDKV